MLSMQEMLDVTILRKKPKRVGRGPGSGIGKTCGRGTGGQRARRGEGIKTYFEGGQFPFVRKIPKFGFSNKKFAKCVHRITLEQLNVLQDYDTVTPELLISKGIVPKRNGKIKILCTGTLVRKGIKLKGVYASSAAEEQISNAL